MVRTYGYKFKMRTGRVIERRLTSRQAYEFATEKGRLGKVHVWGTRKELAQYKKQHPEWWKAPGEKAIHKPAQRSPPKRKPKRRRAGIFDFDFGF